jgi:hypothetical protein
VSAEGAAQTKDAIWARFLFNLGVKPPKTKAVTGHRTPKS